MYHGFDITMSSQLCVNITIINDQLPEDSETMWLRLALQLSDNNFVLQQMTVITIVDDFGEQVITLTSLYFMTHCCTGFAIVPMSVSAVLNTENVSFTCGKEAHFADYVIEWNVENQQTKQTILVGRDKVHTLSFPPTLLYDDAIVTCKLISHSSMPSSTSDPAHLTLQCELREITIIDSKCNPEYAHIITDASIALDRKDYTVSEAMRNLSVYVKVVSSNLPNASHHDVNVTISTASISAQGKWYPRLVVRLVSKSTCRHALKGIH